MVRGRSERSDPCNAGGATRLIMEWREQNGLRWLEAELPGARAAFSTRLGGVSEAPYEALNVAIRTGDEPERVRENRGRLADALGRRRENVVMGRQVHGAQLRRHEGAQQPRVYADAARSPEEVDAHATADPDLTPLVMVADCLPIALTGPGGVAMAHCGWRGLASGIVSEAARAVDAEAAAVGPGIGPCCYEVGEEVLKQFQGVDGVARGRMLDLTAVATRMLEQAGVEGIESSGLCTSCNAELFYSHRRDGERTGRQAGLVWIMRGRSDQERPVS
jgi:purine-nucleoside/S-methyl-5'-thioadenosine phosphorylase / adenosine deaminase